MTDVGIDVKLEQIEEILGEKTRRTAVAQFDIRQRHLTAFGD